MRTIRNLPNISPGHIGQHQSSDSFYDPSKDDEMLVRFPFSFSHQIGAKKGATKRVTTKKPSE
jgi:hypothetical protein